MCACVCVVGAAGVGEWGLARDVQQMAGNGGKGETGIKRGQMREMARG